MPANTKPLFTLTPHVGQVAIATANTNRDGTGTLGSVITGTTNGTRVDRVVIKAAVTTTAGMVRLFVFDGGTTYTLWKEIAVSAITVSGTVASFESVILSPDPNAALLILPNGYILKAGTHNAESFHVTAQAGDY